MKKKDVLAVTEMLSSFIQAGASAQELMKAIAERQPQRHKNFVMIFHTLKAWIESENPDVQLTKAERSICFTALPYIGWNNQIELRQSDFQRLCGYSHRTYFRRLLSSLEKKQVLECRSIGKENYWFFNSFLVKKGSTEGRKPYIKFNLKD